MAWEVSETSCAESLLFRVWSKDQQPKNHLGARQKCRIRDFPAGLGVKTLLCNGGDTGLIPGWGTRIPHAAGQSSPCIMAAEAHALQQERPGHLKKKPQTQASLERSLHALQLEKARTPQQRLRTAPPQFVFLKQNLSTTQKHRSRLC